jgi:hypothetical protein
MSDAAKTLPARVIIQVNDGIPNEIHAFDLPVFETEALKDDPEGAKFGHKVDSREIILALAGAQMKLIENIREVRGEIDSEDAAWLRGLFEWVMSA